MKEELGGDLHEREGGQGWHHGGGDCRCRRGGVVGAAAWRVIFSEPGFRDAAVIFFFRVRKRGALRASEVNTAGISEKKGKKPRKYVHKSMREDQPQAKEQSHHDFCGLDTSSVLLASCNR